MAMKIDLHIHSKCSDGRMSPDEIFQEAHKHRVSLISITDHDSIDCQAEAKEIADDFGIDYIYGLELSVSFTYLPYRNGKPISLDFLGYQFNINHEPLVQKLEDLRNHRVKRAEKILERINSELIKVNENPLTQMDMKAIQESVDGAFGRPHIASYLVKKGLVSNKQEAFDRYLVQCNVPKMPLSLKEASDLVRGAGGKLIFAHPNHPRGTSLNRITPSPTEQQALIKETMLPFIDGIECWHSEHDQPTIDSYLEFAKKLGLLVTGGSDCHQQPLLIGTVDVPAFVAEQFRTAMDM